LIVTPMEELELRMKLPKRSGTKKGRKKEKGDEEEERV
jgi:hypothetical protein